MGKKKALSRGPMEHRHNSAVMPYSPNGTAINNCNIWTLAATFNIAPNAYRHDFTTMAVTGHNAHVVFTIATACRTIQTGAHNIIVLPIHRTIGKRHLIGARPLIRQSFPRFTTIPLIRFFRLDMHNTSIMGRIRPSLQ